MSVKEIKVLIFNLSDEFFATDIMEVERILGYEEPTKIPESLSFVVGVINHEGSILPVISLAKRFNLPSMSINDDTKIIVAKLNEGKLGIVVDAVSEVKTINTLNIEPSPDIVAGISKRYIKGLIKEDKIIIKLLNLATILTDEEMETILTDEESQTLL